MKENPKVEDVSVYADSNTDVRIGYVPPHSPNQPIVNYRVHNHGKINKPFKQKGQLKLKQMSESANFNKKDLKNNPITNYLYFGKYKFSIRYEGQDETCGYCAKIGHNEREYKQKNEIKIFKIGNKQRTQSYSSQAQASSKPSTRKYSNTKVKASIVTRTLRNLSAMQMKIKDA